MSVRVGRRPQDGFYGLVVQNGPWAGPIGNGKYQPDNKEIIRPYAVKSSGYVPLSVVAQRVVKDEPVLISNSGTREDVYAKYLKKYPHALGKFATKTGGLTVGTQTEGQTLGGMPTTYDDDDDDDDDDDKPNRVEYVDVPISYPSVPSEFVKSEVGVSPISTEFFDAENPESVSTLDRIRNYLNSLMSYPPEPPNPVTPESVHEVEVKIENSPLTYSEKKRLRDLVAPLKIVIPEPNDIVEPRIEPQSSHTSPRTMELLRRLENLKDNKISESELAELNSLLQEMNIDAIDIDTPQSVVAAIDALNAMDWPLIPSKRRMSISPSFKSSSAGSSGSSFRPSSTSSYSPTIAQINREFRRRRKRGRG